MYTQKHINQLAYNIVGCAIEVHKELGPGLLESIYEECMLDELADEGLAFKTQLTVPVFYKGKQLKQQYRIDILIEDLVVVELKTIESILPVHKAQVLTYMNILQIPKGLLINFNASNISDKGLVPLVNKIFEALPKE